jgi:signal transduction histidine kinase
MQKHLQQWLQHQTAPVAFTDRQGKLAGTTAAFDSLLTLYRTADGQPADNLLTGLQMLCEDSPGQQTVLRIRDALLADSPSAIQSFVLSHGSGKYCRITLLPQPHEHADDLWIWLFEDASQSLRLEQHQTHSEKMHAIARLAGGMAHELNNMLTAVLGHLELMKLKAAQLPQMTMHIDSAERAALRATTLIQELRRFAGREQQSQQLQPVVPVLQRVVERLKDMAPAGIRVHTNLQNEAQLDCRCNAIQLEDALLKLGTNAIEAIGDATGEICFCARLVQQPPHSVLQILIQDNGTGFSESTRDHVFEPFFTTKDPARSAGLGMAVAYGLIEEMGGNIEVAQSSPAGTEVIVSFPVLNEHPPVNAAEQES